MNTPDAKREITVAFRLTKGEFQPYIEPLKKSGLSRSSFFRRVFVDHEPVIHVRERENPDYLRIICVLNKAGNNLNQLTRKVNTMDKAGLLSSKDSARIYQSLSQISAIMSRLVDDAD